MRKKRLVKAYESKRISALKNKSTRRKTKQKLLYIGSSIFISLVLSLTALQFIISTVEIKPKVVQVLSETTDVVKEKTFWQSILAQTPDYLPGIIELAKIEYSIGDIAASQELMEKARAINPNHPDVKNNENLMLGLR